MSATIRTDFQLTDELHKTIVKSLVSSFGLDFLLFEDKKGGDVATIHNVRKYHNGEAEIHLPCHAKQEYRDRGDYKPTKRNSDGAPVLNSEGKAVKIDRYHSDRRYTKKGAEDKKRQQAGQLNDAYRDKTMKRNEGRQLDHIISSKEVHDDAGRVLSGLSGVELANQESNFQSTHSYINNLKSSHSIDHFIGEVLPRTLEKKKASIESNQSKLELMPTSTPQQRNEKQKLEDKVSKDKTHLEVLESIDPGAMKKADKRARKKYDAEINQKYYTSSKFLKTTAFESAKSGLKMGLRQALGLILAEVWFELKEHIPLLYKENKFGFSFEVFLSRLKNLASDVWCRIQNRFASILAEFKDGVVAGMLSSVTTTVANIFMTTQKMIGKLIREMWSSLVSAVKMLFFNPKNLALGDLSREVIRILSMGVSVAMGVVLNQYLLPFMSFPLGTELAAFISAVASGLMTLGFSYFLDHSELMGKLWNHLNSFKSNAGRALEYFQKVNLELDRYLLNLAAIEFNFNIQEMTCFTDDLISMNSEYEKSLILTQEVERRGIKLPFDQGNLDSARSWLIKL